MRDEVAEDGRRRGGMAPCWILIALAHLVLLTSCATGTQQGDLFADSANRYSPSSPPRAPSARGSDKQTGNRRAGLGPIESSLVDVDYFQGLLVRAGVPPRALPESGRQLTPEDAARLLSWLLEANVPLRDFGPWRMAAHLLWEAALGKAPVSREALYERMRRFHSLLVLRPDGYLVRATTGRAVQHVGQVHFINGTLRAEGFQAGPFYMPRSRFLYPVDDSLEIHPDAMLAGVYQPEEGTLGPAAEGMGQAVMDAVSGLVTLVLHPIDSLAGLAQLPEAVRALIENSPLYWQHFQAMSHGGQVRAVSRLLTNVLITCGTAGAGGARALSAGNKLGKLRVPVISLSGEGALALRMVAVPAGQLVTAVGTGANAVYILHMAHAGASAAGGGGSGGAGGRAGPPPPGGPGKWVQKKEAMSKDASDYQVQVTGTPAGWVYRVFFGPGPNDYVDFDGFVNGVLLEAKGPNLAKFIDKSLEPLPFFEGAEGMQQQALRQLAAAQGTPIRWIVAEKRFADFLQRLFERSGLGSIEVVHIARRALNQE